MSNLTVNGLMEAYAAVYDTDLREQLEEKKEEEIEVQEVGFQIIENAANVLFSQGYDVNDLCDYFAEASTVILILVQAGPHGESTTSATANRLS